MGAALSSSAISPPRVRLGLQGRVSSYFASSLAAVGLLGLLVAAFVDRPAHTGELGALTAVGALGLAAFVHLTGRANPAPEVSPAAVSAHSWVVSRLLLIALVALAVATWFDPTGSVASGDIVPAAGPTPLNDVFASWHGTSRDMGSPGVPLSAPWILVQHAVSLAHGAPWVAQYLWFTFLLATAAVGASSLARTLGASPFASFVCGALFVFNGYTVSWVTVYPVYHAAMATGAWLTASLLGYAVGRWSLRRLVATWALLVPLVAFTTQNPALIVLVAFMVLAVPPLAWSYRGRSAALRATKGLLTASVPALVLSAYWVLPVAFALTQAATGSLSLPDAWTWTESRATLVNGLWLNNFWGWRPDYVPFMGSYDHLPLSVLRFALPIAAFGTLLLPRVTRHRGRLIGALVLAALLPIFLSTGTKSPGRLLFEPLYALPMGWLLREPGRFLMIAALFLAVLAGLCIDELRRVVSGARPVRIRGVLASIAAVGAFVLVAAPAYPLATGSLVADAHSGFPSAHVNVPGYWYETATYANQHALGRNVLMLPVPDFYQMPNTWFYGADDWMTQIVHARVLNPVREGYFKTTGLYDAAALVEKSLLAGNTDLARRVLASLDVGLVVVRGDVVPGFLNRPTTSPARLQKALEAAPELGPLNHFGPLTVLSTPTRTRVGAPFATVNSPTPNLSLLEALPDGYSLVSTPAVQGRPAFVLSPSWDKWTSEGGVLRARLADVPSGELTRGLALDDGSPSPLATRSTDDIGFSAVRSGSDVELSVPVGEPLLGPINATDDLGPLQNCLNVRGTTDLSGLGVALDPRPSDGPVVRLSATRDSACVAVPLQWRTGSFLLDLTVRRVLGSAPRLCVWESRGNRCAYATTVTTAGSEATRERVDVTPDLGSGPLFLYLYADAPNDGGRTVSEYAGIQVKAFPLSVMRGTPFVLVQPSDGAESVQLQTNFESFSPAWKGQGRHVAVNGVTNGWLSEKASPRPASLSLRPIYTAANLTSAAGAVLLALLLLIRRPRRRSAP